MDVVRLIRKSLRFVFECWFFIKINIIKILLFKDRKVVMVYRNINFIKVFMDNLFLLFEWIVEGNELILELLYNFDIFKVLFK